MSDSGETAALEIHAMPGHLIRRAFQVSTAIFTEECAGLDMTSVQFAALVAIEANPEVDATRLSALVAFDRSTLGDVLERLEAKGWVARSPSRADRRVKFVRLTEEGAAALARAKPAVLRVQERLLAPLAPEDRVTMLRLLAQLAHLNDQAAPAPRDAGGNAG